jgi:hypothetical protein
MAGCASGRVPFLAVELRNAGHIPTKPHLAHKEALTNTGRELKNLVWSAAVRVCGRARLNDATRATAAESIAFLF